MIRRDVPLIESPDKWLLVSQVEHARVSAELANAWGGGQVADVVCNHSSTDLHLQHVRSELLAAILHHDDGWAAWEADPAIEPNDGRPYSFLELPRIESLPIWRDSILRAGQIGPLAGWVVAGHFLRLLHESSNDHCEMSDQWLAEVTLWRQQRLNQWSSLNRPVHTERLASECLDWLRLFDWLSLWLCCFCPTGKDEWSPDLKRSPEKHESIMLDEGLLASTPVRLAPSEAKTPDGIRQIVVSPWPFATGSVSLDALGYAVAAKRYATPGELAKSRSPMRLRWQLAGCAEA